MRLYVGPLSRYYEGAASVPDPDIESRGLRVVAGPAALSPEERNRAVVAWRASLNRSLRDHLPEALAWAETPEAESFEAKGDWRSYAALMLLAVYSEKSSPLPDDVPSNWDEDPVYCAAIGGNWQKTRYPSILGPLLWLPGRFDFVFDAVDIAGDQLVIGSSGALLAELKELNEKTLRGTVANLAGWMHVPPHPRAPVAESARFTLSLLMNMGERCHISRLPMRIS